jgi:hypothetical protein
VRFRAIGWNRREARGGPSAASVFVAAAFLLPVFLAACSGGGSAEDGAARAATEAQGSATAGGATAEEDSDAQGSDEWTNYVPLDEPGDDEQPSARSERATCPLTEFRLFLDRERGVVAVLDEAGQIVATADVSTQRITPGACGVTTSRPKRYRDDLDPVLLDESGGVRCHVRDGIEIETFPIRDGRGEVWGSNLVVSLSGRPVGIAGAVAVEDTAGRRLYYSPRYCEPL